MPTAAPAADTPAWRRWPRRFRKPGDALFDRLRMDDEPIRRGLLSREQARDHARELAGWHRLAEAGGGDQLLARLEENAQVIDQTHRRLRQAPEDVPPAAVWLLDNFYLVQDQIKMARQHLPRKYSHQLPRLAEGPNAGLPRVYDLAVELISNVDGSLDAASLVNFVSAYQEVAHLSLGELWAVPIMVRLALLENLRRVALRVAWQQHDRSFADGWADRALAAADRPFDAFLRAVSDIVSRQPPLTAAFVARLTQRLSGRVPHDNVVLQWLAERLAQRGQTIEGLVALDQQAQAADQLSIGNSITTLRALDALDWKEFVEGQSRVEAILRGDPAGVYAAMEFGTRDDYRHVVETLARRSPLSEEQVAEAAIGLAAEAVRPNVRDEAQSLRRHVGYYLRGRGRELLERRVGYRPEVWRRAAAAAGRRPLVAYLGGTLLVWLAATAGLAAGGAALGGMGAGWSTLAVLLLAAAFPMALSLVNWIATLAVAPRRIARLDFSTGIPRECRTLVAVPTMLTSAKGIANLLDQLEVRYLANQDEQLLFALLTDFADAPSETMPTDAALLQQAVAGIHQLNDRHCAGRPGQFFLLHRARTWSKVEGVWMGEERKRGKLAAMNRLLWSTSAAGFSVTVGDLAELPAVRYVITLDSDTQLPRDAARKLVGCMAHPLNRPRIDPGSLRVVEGYGILQPRATITIPQANQTPFSRLFAGDAGIDPYTSQTSDVYQDLFAEGSFIGKGIYDVHAFETSLGGRFPANRVLSHDLIEGCYARSGLVADIEVFEGYPARLLADMSRRHRWIRGDWQIAAWLLPRVPAEGRVAHNHLSWLSRWKIFDNLRRSLSPAAMLGFLLTAWIVEPHLAGYWTAAAALLVFAPAIVCAVPGVLRPPRELPLRLHLRAQSRSLAAALAREAVGWCILPYVVHCNLDAVARTLYRLYVSRRKLLEWTTASEAEVLSKASLRNHYEVMWACTVVSLSAATTLGIVYPMALVATGPALLSWLAGPALAWRLSQPPAVRQKASVDDRRQMAAWARRTWHYFDTHLAAVDNWLIPDNVQHTGEWTIATRTSPTNIGMALLADLAACDMGYLPPADLLERSGKTAETLARLDRYRGHWYNWYDTRSLRAAEPRYVSSVDSGNLWGSVCLFREGLAELGQRPIVGPRLAAGLRDGVAVLVELAAAERHGPAAWDAGVESLDALLAAEPQGARAALQLLTAARDALAQLPLGGASRDVVQWCAALERQAERAAAELHRLAFWATVGPLAPLASEGLRPAAAELDERLARLDARVPLADLAEQAGVVAQASQRLASSAEGALAAAESLANLAVEAAAVAARAIRELRAAIDRWGELMEMDFRFLYDPAKKLLTIGFNASERRRDASYYDLLASEARLTSFLAVAHGQLPVEHWFALGRLVTYAEGKPALLSWSGSMFEYLLPALLMPSYPTTLLDETCRAAVSRQIRYARRLGIPWGISESCYNQVESNGAYRYRAFGVPGLGLARGLEADRVVAPYASAMAAPMVPDEACRNLRRLRDLGCISIYGYFDAIDYTPSRRPPQGSPAPCRSVMAHHSGMALLGFCEAVLERPMSRRFNRNALCRAHDLLLQERVPPSARPIDPDSLTAAAAAAEGRQPLRQSLRVFTSPHTAAPEVHLLSNGRYHVMLTAAGGGQSRWRDLALTRWHEDATGDHFGQFCYLRDTATGRVWSTAYQPTRREPDKYQAIFSQGRVEYRVLDDEIDARTQIAVSSEDDVEVRQVTLTNLSRFERTIEATSYAEVALAEQDADRSHPAFSKLFVITEALPELGAVLATRRRASTAGPWPWMFHLVFAESAVRAPASVESRREVFLGRLRTAERPRAMDEPGPLAAGDGAVLDPIVAARQQATLQSEETATVYFVTGVAETREQALALLHRYRDPQIARRVFELSRAHSQLALERLGIAEADAQLFARMAAALVFRDGRHRRGAPETAAGRPQQALWPLGISGDRPIVVVRCTNAGRLKVAEQLLAAHAYWRGKGLCIDLVLWVGEPGGYRQELFDALARLVASSPGAELVGAPAGIHLHRDAGDGQSLAALEAAAAIYLVDTKPLDEQVKDPAPSAGPQRQPSQVRPSGPFSARRPADLLLYNGYGGFTPDGREYVCVVSAERPTPAPWCNVLANPSFGTVVSEAGLGYTWSENSRQFRLTPWSNDPTADPPGEAVYIVDEESGEVFSATPLPAPAPQGYLCRHGFGYTRWESTAGELDVRLTVFVGLDRAAKYALVSLHNRGGRPRRLQVVYYVEWVMGEHRGKTQPHTVTEVDAQTGAVLARNPFSMDHPGTVAVLAGEKGAEATADRTEFLGRNGTTAAPAGLRQPRFSGRAGAGLDAAAAVRHSRQVAPGQQAETVFVLAAADNSDRARELVARTASTSAARRELQRVQEYWLGIVETIECQTPDPAANVMARWLLYQTVACRLFARSGFYQSSGAYGFRDQLQDSLALLWAAPELTREHLLRAASRQFREGDVQHWWHADSGGGVRTKVADDPLWLPYVATRYVEATGDRAVLDQPVAFLHERPLGAAESSLYSAPPSTEAEPLYEHCRRALSAAAATGAHGLPLMREGDWNDGMNGVGAGGRGESVWLAAFRIAVLEGFCRLAAARGDEPTAAACRSQAEGLRQAIAAHGWDGAWFRRAYDDDGRAIGSASQMECQIDAVAQSWAVLARAAPPARLRLAMHSVEQRLLRRDARLLPLLAPPFQAERVGYIASYPPGIRENGGQYNHAAAWTAWAFAELGDAARAWECFRIINPANRSTAQAEAEAYRGEPYSIAADVSTGSGHDGKAGWTGYTGSAAWTWRLLVEGLLGLRLVEGRRLRFEPCPPESWQSYAVTLRRGTTRWRIEFAVAGRPAHHVAAVTVDGVAQPDRQVQLVEDGAEHHVVVRLGPDDGPAAGAP